MRHPFADGQRGLTLVELMISLTLGLILVTAIATLFVYSNRNNRQSELLNGMQDQARFALSQLSRDITMAGYWGGMASAGTIRPNLNNTIVTDDDSTASTAFGTSSDCGINATTRWAFELTAKASSTQTTNGVTTTTVTTWPSRLEFRNQDASSTVASQWRCIGNHRSGTDVVATRRVAAQVTATRSASATSETLRPYHYYLKTNGLVGTMIRWGSSPTTPPSDTLTEEPLSAPYGFYRYVPRIYYVRNYARTAGDGIPTLCRKELCSSGYSAGANSESGSCSAGGSNASASGFYSECLAEGVEDMQIVWGIRSSDDSFRYTSTPSAQELAENVTTAQIFLRMRSVQSDPLYRDLKSYTAGDSGTYTPSSITDPTGTAEADKTVHYYRRIYSTTVYVRNPSRL